MDTTLGMTPEHVPGGAVHFHEEEEGGGEGEGDTVASVDIDGGSQRANSIDRSSALHCAEIEEGDQLLSYRGLDFASLEEISPFIPEADPAHPRARTFRVWRSKRHTVLTTCSITAAIVFMVNLIAITAFQTVYKSGTIYRGDCNKASKLDSALHVLINVLATILLSASNLCMQLLAAPTRDEVNLAHAKGSWLDIGVPSFRNLKHIAMQRRISWFILAFSSLPLHFLYNSAIYSTKPVNSYNYLVVSPPFLADAPVDLNRSSAIATSRQSMKTRGRQQISPFTMVESFLDPGWNTEPDLFEELCGQNCQAYRKALHEGPEVFTRVEASECLTTYMSSFGNRSDVILVATYDLLHPGNMTEHLDLPLLLIGRNMGLSVAGTYWPCGTSNSFDCRPPNDREQDQSSIQNWNVFGYKIDYCLASQLDNSRSCRLGFSLSIMIIVAVANAIKCVVIAYTAAIYSHPYSMPLSTMGDAVASFLEENGTMTSDMCLAEPVLLKTDASYWKNPSPRVFQHCRFRWHQAATSRRWACTLVPCLTILCVGLTILLIGLRCMAARTGSLTTFVHLGFGLTQDVLISGLRMGFYKCVLFANIWQFTISVLYVQYNSLLSTMLANREWMRYTDRKPLRVTSPRGLQRSTYFVSMPWRYGAPLIFTYAFLHWTLSQSIFVVPFDEVSKESPIPSPGDMGIKTGYSIWPIITSIGIGLVLIIAICICGLQSYSRGMPLGATNSVILSAACHQLQLGDRDAYLFPVQWGTVSATTDVEVKTDQEKQDTRQIRSNSADDASPCGTTPENRNIVNVGHCTLTTYRDVRPPVEGQLYK